MCTACKPFAPRNLGPYFDTREQIDVNEPFCDGVCMHYKMEGAILESVRGAGM